MTASPPVIAKARRRRLQEAGLGWFDEHGRAFAFRGPRDAYLVLTSEVILQQTQVSRGEPAWLRFTARFPTFAALASASTADVLRAWSGLGYNRRALALQRTAQIAVDRWGGRLPADLAGLETLPGVGPYTARAVAAICFGLPVAPVDTNVRRVLGRIVGPRRPLRAAGLQSLADTLVPADRPAAWSAALMDIGSLFCRPSAPACAVCPLRGDCWTARHPAASQPRAAATRRPGPGSTSAARRRLRGAIVERLRRAPDGEWVRLDGPDGPTAAEPALADILAGLARDGLVQLDGTIRARLPVGSLSG